MAKRKLPTLENIKVTKAYAAIAWQMLKISWHVRPVSVVVNIFGGILETAASILTIYASAKLAAILAQFVATGNAEGAWFWLWVDIGAAALTGLGFWIMRYTQRLLFYAINNWVVETFFRTLTTMDIASHYDSETRNMINKAQSGYTFQLPNLTYAILDLIYGIIKFVAIAVVVAQIGWWLVLIIAAFLVPTLLADAKIAKLSWVVWNEKGDDKHIFGGISGLFTRAQAQMEMRSMQSRSYLRKRASKINEKFHARQEAKYKSAGFISISAKFLEVGGIAIGSVYLLKQLLGGAISLEKYFFLSGALLRVGGALNNIFGTLSRMQDSLQFAENFFNLIKVQPTIVDKENAVALSDKEAPLVEFINVSFTYPGQDKPVFKNLSFTIKPGEHIALVGENGAGKSTIIKLLLRYYLPDSGEIRINGIDIKEVAIESWYKMLATLFQYFNAYPLPVDENIYIADPTFRNDQERLEKAARYGGALSVIQDLEHGWDTVLDASFQKGIEPSGGQWQRIALSRAFFRDAMFLILDEPTSAIDAKAEYEIFNSVFKHYQHKSALIVSHRFSTVRRASRIIVLEHGEIIEQGSHRELMKKNGLYHELFTKQAEGYRD
jgi:ATP-binding cassette subfamily B protein